MCRCDSRPTTRASSVARSPQGGPPHRRVQADPAFAVPTLHALAATLPRNYAPFLHSARQRPAAVPCVNADPEQPRRDSRNGRGPISPNHPLQAGLLRSWSVLPMPALTGAPRCDARNHRARARPASRERRASHLAKQPALERGELGAGRFALGPNEVVRRPGIDAHVEQLRQLTSSLPCRQWRGRAQLQALVSARGSSGDGRIGRMCPRFWSFP